MRKEGEQRREHLLDKARQLQDRANKHKAKVSRNIVQGDPSARGLGCVNINYVSFGGHPETDLSQHNPVREQMDHPVDYHGSHRPNKYSPPAFLNL